jgi:hypothetical protein
MKLSEVLRKAAADIEADTPRVIDLPQYFKAPIFDAVPGSYTGDSPEGLSACWDASLFVAKDLRKQRVAYLRKMADAAEKEGL